MTSETQTTRPAPARILKGHVLLGLFLTFFLYGAFFYSLVRGQHSLMLVKQRAFESLKILGIPGAAFLQEMGGMAIFSSSLFFTILLGLMIVVFLLLSLSFRSSTQRAVYLGAGLVALGILTLRDRMGLPFMLVSTLAFTSFFLLSLGSRIFFSLMDSVVALSMMALLSGSLVYGSNHWFFLKLRDRALFDSAIGNRIISFYYTYSPLAAGPISPVKGIYQGLIYDEKIKNDDTHYVGGGLFVTGNAKFEEAADFSLARDGERVYLASRHGNRVPLKEIDQAELEQAASRLFDMRGLLRLSSAALYFFPAGVLVLCLLGLRVYTHRRGPFLLFCAGLTLFLLSFIWYVTLTGNRPPTHPPASPERLYAEGLSLAYYLFEQKRIPVEYIPAVRWMVQSKSEALRYWGANLMGMTGNKGEAQTIVGLLEDASPNVRYTACISLFKLLERESLQYLLPRLLTDKNWYVRCRVYSIFLKAGLIPSPA